MFTNTPEVIAELEGVWANFCIFIIFDSIQLLISTDVTVSGKQMIGAIASWIAYPIVGLGLIYHNVFVAEKGLPGIWSGATVAVLILTLTYAIYFCVEDWDKVCADAAERIKMEKSNVQ